MRISKALGRKTLERERERKKERKKEREREREREGERARSDDRFFYIMLSVRHILNFN